MHSTVTFIHSLSRFGTVCLLLGIKLLPVWKGNIECSPINISTVYSNFSNDAILVSLIYMPEIYQGVPTLSEKCNLLILPIQSLSIYDSLDSNWPQDVRNLHTGCKIWICLLMPPWTHKNDQKWAPIGLIIEDHKNGKKGSKSAYNLPI